MSFDKQSVLAGAATASGIGLAIYGLGEAGYSLSSAFNHVSSPQAQLVIKEVAALGGMLLGGSSLGAAGMHIHRKHELGALAYAAGYTAIGVMGGALGGWHAAEHILPHAQDRKSFEQPEKPSDAKIAAHKVLSQPVQLSLET